MAGPYRTGDLAGAFVAIAATDDEGINARVAEDAAAMNVLVNVVTVRRCAPSPCRHCPPGRPDDRHCHRGRCPALAGSCGRNSKARYGLEYAELVGLFGEARRK